MGEIPSIFFKPLNGWPIWSEPAYKWALK